METRREQTTRPYRVLLDAEILPAFRNSPQNICCASYLIYKEDVGHPLKIQLRIFAMSEGLYSNSTQKLLGLIISLFLTPLACPPPGLFFSI